MRRLLLPFSLLYHLATALRNWLFNRGYLRSYQPKSPLLIGVGNLTVGGTGKTPMVEYLTRWFQAHYPEKRIAILSRGYGRKTEGFLLATQNPDPEAIGDEPAQYHRKLGSSVSVAVHEKRVAGAKQLQKTAAPDLILLDDCFQHRYIRPHILLLLNDFHRPFFRDWLLPAGNLRESRSGARRASAVITTKTPADLSQAQRGNFEASIRHYTKRKAQLFFSRVAFGSLKMLVGSQPTKEEKVAGFAGIARPQTFREYLDKNFALCYFKPLPDHQGLSPKQLRQVLSNLEQNQPDCRTLLCTEKDAIKIRGLLQKMPETHNWKIGYVPIEPEFLNSQPSFSQWLQNKLQQRKF